LGSGWNPRHPIEDTSLDHFLTGIQDIIISDGVSIMSDLTEILLTLLLVSSSAYMIWTILRIRQRRLESSFEHGNGHIGDAKEPQILMEPSPDALDQMEELLEKAGLSLPDE